MPATSVTSSHTAATPHATATKYGEPAAVMITAIQKKESVNPDGQLKLPQLWSPKIPHRVKQDEVEFYSSFVFCARASAASLSR